MEITLKIDGRSKQAKAFLAYVKTLPFVVVKEHENGPSLDNKRPYNAEFLEKIERAEKEIENGDYSVVDTKDVWGSLGL